MSFNVLSFLGDHGIFYVTEREGWANLRCPFCGDTGTHGGFNVDEGYYHCWRCGSKPLATLISELLHCSFAVTKQVLDRYDNYFGGGGLKAETKYAKTFELPGLELKPPHAKYIEGRGFDPEWIKLEYGIKATLPNQNLFDMNWGSRVVIPLHDGGGRVIGCQGRDITGRHKLRYLGSPLESSLADYKEMLYAAHYARSTQVAVVEGVMDAWRLGRGFVASYGTSMTKAQLKMLTHWDRIFFIFDSEATAQSKARQYATHLTSIGKDVEILELELGGRDPAEMKSDEAQYLRRELGFR